MGCFQSAQTYQNYSQQLSISNQNILYDEPDLEAEQEFQPASQPMYFQAKLKFFQNIQPLDLNLSSFNQDHEQMTLPQGQDNYDNISQCLQQIKCQPSLKGILKINNSYVNTSTSIQSKKVRFRKKQIKPMQRISMEMLSQEF